MISPNSTRPPTISSPRRRSVSDVPPSPAIPDRRARRSAGSTRWSHRSRPCDLRRRWRIDALTARWITVGAFAAYSITWAGLRGLGGRARRMVVRAVPAWRSTRGSPSAAGNVRNRNPDPHPARLNRRRGDGPDGRDSAPRNPTLVALADLLGTSVQNNLVVVFVLSWVLIGGLFGSINYTNAARQWPPTGMSTGGECGHRSSSHLYLVGNRGAARRAPGLFLGSYRTATGRWDADLLAF